MTFLPQSGTAAAVSLATLLLTACSGGTVTSPPGSTTPGSSSSCATPAVAISHTATAVNNPQLVVLNTAKYPQAICNDGTAAAYVLRPGSGSAASRWVISLQGGSMCYSNATCSARAASQPYLVGTSLYQANPVLAYSQAGLQSANSSVNPDFYDATQVQILYCSSDYWSGAKTASGTFDPNNVQTWNFQGHAILAAAIADLQASHGLSGATEILFSGESAGGVGVFVNVNAVAKLVPSTARFVAASDAGFGNSTALDFNPNGQPPNYTDSSSLTGWSVPTTANIWNGTGDSVCQATVGTGCYNAQQLLGANATITLPMLVIEAQKDTIQLNNNGVPQADINSGVFTTAETGYISYFATQMRTGLLSTNANVSLFSPNALIHTEAASNSLFTTGYTFPTGTLTPQQAVSTWYKAPCTVQRSIQN
jgi:O-palmitoleoyl-L-serine hydrolase